MKRWIGVEQAQNITWVFQESTSDKENSALGMFYESTSNKAKKDLEIIKN
jgi:hypothetical protein